MPQGLQGRLPLFFVFLFFPKFLVGFIFYLSLFFPLLATFLLRSVFIKFYIIVKSEHASPSVTRKEERPMGETNHDKFYGGDLVCFLLVTDDMVHEATKSVFSRRR